MAKKGRPTDYKKEFNHQAYIATREGMADKALAKLFSISTVTLNAWKKKYPDFLNSLKKGKDEFDTNKVENAFLKRALGFDFIEVSTEIDKDGHLIKEKSTNKVVVPDTAAAFIWLKNRNPERWRDKQEIQQTIVEKEDLSKWSDDDLRLMAELKAKYNKDEM